MTDDLPSLERRALELMKTADFGDESVRVNAAIVERRPRDEGAWTRLGRCYLEQRRFDEAVAALRTALAINPAKTIATNLLAEVRKRRALTPAVQRAATGFTSREFALIESLAGDELLEALQPRIEALFDTLNQSSVAGRIVDARLRGEAGAKLFHANSCHAASTPGHVYAFHHGGRWEPQFNLGWFARPVTASCMRIGVGFHFSHEGRDPDRQAGQEAILQYFERFQQALASSWRGELARWLGVSGGFLQYGRNPPSLDLLPKQAIERVLLCGNPIDVGWIFIGRWLFLADADDARTLRERSKLARAIDDTFRALLPIWLSIYAPR